MPLPELVGAAVGHAPSSKGVQREYALSLIHICRMRHILYNISLVSPPHIVKIKSTNIIPHAGVYGYRFYTIKAKSRGLFVRGIRCRCCYLKGMRVKAPPPDFAFQRLYLMRGEIVDVLFNYLSYSIEEKCDQKVIRS